MLLVILIAAALAALWQSRSAPGVAPSGTYPPMPGGLTGATVVRAVDGDTVDVRLATGRERVRLIGLDAPESHASDRLDRQAHESGRSRDAILAMGREAAEYTAQRLDSRDVLLELDVERRDRYGRLLAYVWLPDGTLFNGELLWAGMAQVLTIPPNVRYADLFLRLQRDARDARRGFWGR